MKTKYYLGMIAIALFGIWGSKLLNFSLFSPKVMREARFDIKGFDIKPYQRANLDNDREAKAFLAKTKAYRVAGVGTFKPSAQVVARPAAPAVAVKKAAAIDPKKAAADKKKKAALAKKKKEKRNRRGGVINNYESDTALTSTAPSQRATRSEASENFSNGTFATSSGSAGPSAAAQAKEAKDLEYWKDALLQVPSKENTTEFIRAFQKNEISEEIFYTLIQLMYDERTVEYQTLAVTAAGSVSNIKSFDFFVAVLADQRQGSSVAANAESQLNEYSSLNSIFIVRQVLTLRSEDEQKIFYAVLALDTSTQPATGETDLTATQRQAFNGFIPALENILSLYATNTQITEPGQRALDRIKALNPVVAQNQVNQ